MAWLTSQLPAEHCAPMPNPQTLLPQRSWPCARVVASLPLARFLAGLVLTPVWFTARSLPWVTACDAPPSKLLNLYSKHTAGIALFCPIWYCLRQNTLCHNWLLLMSSFRGAWCQCHHHLSLLTAGNGRRWHLPTAWLFCHPLELRHHRRSQLCIRSSEPDLYVSPYLLIPAVCCSPSPSLLHGPLFSAVLSSEWLFLPPVRHLCWQSVLWFLLQVKLFFNLWCSPPQTKH